MPHVNISLGHLLSKMLWKAEEPSHELHGPQNVTDVSFVSESYPPKIVHSEGFKEVWSNITKYLIDVGYFCSTPPSPLSENKTNKKNPTKPKKPN